MAASFSSLASRSRPSCITKSRRTATESCPAAVNAEHRRAHRGEQGRRGKADRGGEAGRHCEDGARAGGRGSWSSCGRGSLAGGVGRWRPANLPVLLVVLTVSHRRPRLPSPRERRLQAPSPSRERWRLAPPRERQRTAPPPGDLLSPARSRCCWAACLPGERSGGTTGGLRPGLLGVAALCLGANAPPRRRPGFPARSEGDGPTKETCGWGTRKAVAICFNPKSGVTTQVLILWENF
jgi:hypothetical protein